MFKHRPPSRRHTHTAPLGAVQVTKRPGDRTFTLMKRQPTWPFEEFNDYLETLMEANGIASRAELADLSGVSQSQFSIWKKGKYRPSKENLRKLAPVLKVPVVKLEIQAGLASADELELDSEPDFTVQPRQINVLAANYVDAERNDPTLAGEILVRVEQLNEWIQLRNMHNTPRNRTA